MIGSAKLRAVAEVLITHFAFNNMLVNFAGGDVVVLGEGHVEILERERLQHETDKEALRAIDSLLSRNYRNPDLLHRHHPEQRPRLSRVKRK